MAVNTASPCPEQDTPSFTMNAGSGRTFTTFSNVTRSQPLKSLTCTSYKVRTVGLTVISFVLPKVLPSGRFHI